MNYGEVIDEQCLPTGLRHRLNGNGIRAGVINGDIPAALAKRFLQRLILLKARLTTALSRLTEPL